MIFRYPGGKSRPAVQKLILDHFPPDYAEYREPFVGGGGIFFAVPSAKRRWINDLNRHLISVYLALRDRPAKFIQMCREIPQAGADEAIILSKTGFPRNKRLQDLFYSLRDDPDADPALKYFFLHRTGFNGRVILDGLGVKRTTYLSPDGWRIVGGKRIEAAAEHLAGTAITCSDYEMLFTEPGDGVLVYADPPYVRDTELPRSAKLYQHGFSVEDHKRLARIVMACGHKVCLSYDDHPLIRRLYKDLFVHPQSWTYGGTTSVNKKRGQELVITNYPVLKTQMIQTPVFAEAKVSVETVAGGIHFEGLRKTGVKCPIHPDSPFVVN